MSEMNVKPSPRGAFSAKTNKQYKQTNYEFIASKYDLKLVSYSCHSYKIEKGHMFANVCYFHCLMELRPASRNIACQHGIGPIGNHT